MRLEAAYVAGATANHRVTRWIVLPVWVRTALKYPDLAGENRVKTARATERERVDVAHANLRWISDAGARRRVEMVSYLRAVTGDRKQTRTYVALARIGIDGTVLRPAVIIDVVSAQHRRLAVLRTKGIDKC